MLSSPFIGWCKIFGIVHRVHWHPRQSKDLKGTGFSQKDPQNRNHHLDTANSNSWEANPFAVFFIHTILPIDAKTPCSERIEISLTAILKKVKALFFTFHTTIRLFPFPPGLVFSSCHLWIKGVSVSITQVYQSDSLRKPCEHWRQWSGSLVSPTSPSPSSRFSSEEKFT